MMAVKKNAVKVTDDDIRAARLRRELAMAELKELELAERKGELVAADEAEKQMGSMILNAKSKLLALPGKLAPQLAGLHNAGIVESLIRAEIYAVLNELASGGEDGGDEQ